MKYLVTGGAGFIGSHIADLLVHDHHDVVILDNFFSGRKENISHLSGNKQVRFIDGSITNPAVLKSACESVDGIFHEAAIASVARSVNNPGATNEANVTGTLNVLVAARDAGVKKVVFASSSSVYGDTPTLPKKESMCPCPKSPYAVSKHAGEEYLRVFSELYGLKTLSFRYFNVFGPRQDPQSGYAAVIPKFITRILSHECPVIYGDGTQTRDFTYVKDVADANVRAMESTAEGVYNIAYGQQIDLNSLANLIMSITGIRAKPVYEPARPGDIHDSLADSSRARDAFGYNPRYTVKTGLEETIRWYQDRMAK
ncbi:MAG: SDR family oxidoreductase [Methanoregula sp.]|jgi:UDP-glucose 4-epimerase